MNHEYHQIGAAAAQLADRLRHGRGLRQYAKTSYGVELTESQAEQYRHAFFEAYPGLRQWHIRVGRSERAPVETRTLSGRRVLQAHQFNEKLNLPVQGTGADGLKMAMALLWERRAEVPGAFPVLAVHDEIVVEAPKDDADAVAQWLKQAMLDAMNPLVAPVPVEVDVAIATTWGGPGLPRSARQS